MHVKVNEVRAQLIFLNQRLYMGYYKVNYLKYFKINLLINILLYYTRLSRAALEYRAHKKVLKQ